MNPTDEIYAYLDDRGPSPQTEIEAALPHLRSQTIRNCITGLARRGAVERLEMVKKTGSVGGHYALWGAVDVVAKPDTSQLAALALANRTDLERAWR